MGYRARRSCNRKARRVTTTARKGHEGRKERKLNEQLKQQADKERRERANILKNG